MLGCDLCRSGRGGQRVQGRDQDLVPQPVQGREGDRVAGQLGDPAVKAAVVLDRLLEATGRRGVGGVGGGVTERGEFGRGDPAITLAVRS
jgi:hypothetical protein